MGYYRGDDSNYYRGDYYKGDPFLGALVGSVAGKVIGRAGAALGRAVGRARRVAGPIIQEMAPSAAAGAVGMALGRRGSTLPTLGPLTDHKHDKYGRDMAAFPKRRRLNALNPKALRRALRRAEGFERFAKRTVNALYKTVDGRRVRTFKKKSA